MQFAIGGPDARDSLSKHHPSFGLTPPSRLRDAPPVLAGSPGRRWVGESEGHPAQEQIPITYLTFTYEPSARVRHQASASGGGEYSPFQSFYRWRNRLLLMEKNARGLPRAFFFAVCFSALAAWGLLR